MRISNQYINGLPVDASSLSALPIRSEKIEEIFRRVKQRVESQP